METLVPSVSVPNLTPGNDSPALGGSFDVSGTGLENLKPGMSLNAGLQTGLGGLITGIKLEVNNRMFEIPVKLTLSGNVRPELFSENRTYPAEIRITAARENLAAFKLITIDGQPADKFMLKGNVPNKEPLQANAPVIINAGADIKPDVQLHPLTLKAAVSELLGVKPLPSRLAAELPDVEFEFGFQKVLLEENPPQPQETANALQSLKNLLQNPEKPDFNLRMEKALQSLTGKILTAQTIIQPETKQTEFMTPLGDIVSAMPLKLSNGLPVELLIRSVRPTEQILPSLSPADGVRLLEELAAMPLTGSAPETKASSSDGILNFLKSEALPREISAAVMNKLPAANKNMLQNMVNYVKASVQRDIGKWLGAEVVERLTASGTEGQEALRQLNGAFASSVRETPVWRLVEIPFFTGEGMEKIRLAVKKYNDEDEETPEQQKQKYGTRFVVDTHFSKLGRFQFDGYSLPRDRRFDLIIRTERAVDEDICANIMRIFKNTLNQVEYVGTVKVNIKENFIKIGEDMNNDVLPAGIFI